MAYIYLLNSRGGTRSFDFGITYFYPIIVTPTLSWLYKALHIYWNINKLINRFYGKLCDDSSHYCLVVSYKKPVEMSLSCYILKPCSIPVFT